MHLLQERRDNTTVINQEDCNNAVLMYEVKTITRLQSADYQGLLSHFVQTHFLSMISNLEATDDQIQYKNHSLKTAVHFMTDTQGELCFQSWCSIYVGRVHMRIIIYQIVSHIFLGT